MLLLWPTPLTFLTGDEASAGVLPPPSLPLVNSGSFAMADFPWEALGGGQGTGHWTVWGGNVLSGCLSQLWMFYQNTGWLRQLLSFTILQAEKSKIKVLANSVPGESSLPGL